MVHVQMVRDEFDRSYRIDIGTRSSRVHIKFNTWDLEELYGPHVSFIPAAAIRHGLVDEEFRMLFDFIKRDGEVLNITLRAAIATIQYLKETN